MTRAALVLCVMCVIGVTHAFNPMSTPQQSAAFLRMKSNSLIGDEPDVGATDALTDAALVTGQFGSNPVNMENLKFFIKQRGLSDLGLLSDLITRAACIIRLEANIGSQLNPTSLNDFLTSRGMSVSGSRDDLFDRSCGYLTKELVVRQFLQRPFADISIDDLKLQLSNLGFISVPGNKADLVVQLGNAVNDLQIIRNFSGDPTFDTTSLRDTLKSKGLAVDGSTGTLLDRLANYFLSVASSSGNSSAQCDIILSGSVCVAGGQKVLAPDATPRGLIGRWTFDDESGSDKSGFGNNAKVPPAVGIGVNGVGSSAYFDSNTMLEIEHSDQFNSQDFCVTLWLYLLGDSTGQWRTLIHKGTRDNERTPTLFFEPQTRGLEFFVSTTDTTQPSGERLWSNTFIPLRQWTHIAACAEGRNLRLYINGLLDAENTTIGTPILNQGSLYVGNDPWRSAPGGVASYIDELRYYARALSIDEVQMQAQLGLGGVEPSFVELGCLGCTLDICPKSCRRGFRLCASRDLYGGAYQVARSMGWANSETRIWSAEDVREGADTPQASGLCMCCREEE